MSTQKAFYDFVRVLTSRSVHRDEGLENLLRKHLAEPDQWWRAIGMYRDLRGGKTLFMYAAAANALDLTALILERGCDVHATDISGRNAAHYAAATDSVQWLKMADRKDLCLDMFLRDKDQKRPEDLAVYFGSTKAKMYLDEKRAEVIQYHRSEVEKLKRGLEQLHPSDRGVVLDHLYKTHEMQQSSAYEAEIDGQE